MTNHAFEITPTQRAVIVLLMLLRGRAVTIPDIMRATGCAERTAHDVLDRLSTLDFPIYQPGRGNYALLPEYLHEFKRNLKAE